MGLYLGALLASIHINFKVKRYPDKMNAVGLTKIINWICCQPEYQKSILFVGIDGKNTFAELIRKNSHPINVQEESFISEKEKSVILTGESNHQEGNITDFFESSYSKNANNFQYKNKFKLPIILNADEQEEQIITFIDFPSNYMNDIKKGSTSLHQKLLLAGILENLEQTFLVFSIQNSKTTSSPLNLLKIFRNIFMNFIDLFEKKESLLESIIIIVTNVPQKVEIEQMFNRFRSLFNQIKKQRDKQGLQFIQSLVDLLINKKRILIVKKEEEAISYKSLITVLTANFQNYSFMPSKNKVISLDVINEEDKKNASEYWDNIYKISAYLKDIISNYVKTKAQGKVIRSKSLEQHLCLYMQNACIVNKFQSTTAQKVSDFNVLELYSYLAQIQTKIKSGLEITAEIFKDILEMLFEKRVLISQDSDIYQVLKQYGYFQSKVKFSNISLIFSELFDSLRDDAKQIESKLKCMIRSGFDVSVYQKIQQFINEVYQNGKLTQSQIQSANQFRIKCQCYQIEAKYHSQNSRKATHQILKLCQARIFTQREESALSQSLVFDVLSVVAKMMENVHDYENVLLIYKWCGKLSEQIRIRELVCFSGSFVESHSQEYVTLLCELLKHRQAIDLCLKWHARFIDARKIIQSIILEVEDNENKSKLNHLSITVRLKKIPKIETFFEEMKKKINEWLSSTYEYPRQFL